MKEIIGKNSMILYSWGIEKVIGKQKKYRQILKKIYNNKKLFKNIEKPPIQFNVSKGNIEGIDLVKKYLNIIYTGAMAISLLKII
jgi:hypothetical protein